LPYAENRNKEQCRIKASEENLARGEYKVFKTEEEVFAHLDSLKNEER